MTIDLRSDTVSRPTDGMRHAMATADVGDDCYGDDPTVIALEHRVAALLGKEHGVFVPSGTMANQLALRIHTTAGHAVACAPGAHVQIHENAGAAALAGVQLMPIGTPRGFTADELVALIREETSGWPRIELVWLENTLGHAGGALWPIDALEAIARVGRPIHLDGARLWNAHVASGIPLARYAAVADTISVCLSKGLGAPMGSVLCGTAAAIARARELRHAYGGATRQAGIVAAAGLYAVEHQLARLADDHRRARELAAALARLPCWTVREPDTNIVLAETTQPAAALCERIVATGVLCHPNSFDTVRFVLHLGIDDALLAEAIARIRLACTV